jgi:hypothetical protein
MYQVNGCVLPTLTLLPHFSDTHKSVHTKQYDFREDICFKLYLSFSSPSLTEVMHCSCEQIAAKDGHHLGFPLNSLHHLHHFNQFMNMLQHKK